MSNPSIEIVWERQLPHGCDHGPIISDDGVIVRSGPRLYKLDASTGSVHWDLDIDPEHSTGRFLHSAPDAVVTDRIDAESLTHAVIIRERRVAFATPLRSIVPRGASTVVDGLLYTAGIDPQIGRSVLRATNIATGRMVIDRALDFGADEVAATEAGLVIVNRSGHPGLYRVSRDATVLDAPIDEPVQQLVTVDGRALAVVRDDDGSQRRTLKMLEGPSLTPRWQTVARNAVVAFDGDAVVHFAPEGDTFVPVLTDARNGGTRWRGEALELDGTIYLAGPLVGIRQGRKAILLRRDDGAPAGELTRASRLTLLHDKIFVAGSDGIRCLRALM